MTNSKMTLSNPLVPLACGLWLIVGCDHDDDEVGLDEGLDGQGFRSTISGDYKSGKALNTSDIAEADAKATEWGYPAPGDLHHAARRMVMADFCGTESPNTNTGTPVGYVNLLDETNEGFRKIYRGDDMEAAWNQYGAVCINHSRIDGEIPCTLPQCPPMIDKSYALLWSQSWDSRECGILKSDQQLLRGGDPIISCNGSGTLTFRSGTDLDLVVEDRNGEKTWSLKEGLAKAIVDAVVAAVPNSVSGAVEDAVADAVVDAMADAAAGALEDADAAAMRIAIRNAVENAIDDAVAAVGLPAWFPTVDAGAMVDVGPVADAIAAAGALLGAHHLHMQANGIFAFHDATHNLLLKMGEGSGIPGAVLLLQNDGNVCTSEQTDDERRWCTNSGWCRANGQTLLMGDVDGDGTDDLVCHDSTAIRFAYAKNELSGTDYVYPVPWCIGADQQFMLGDVDGDGRDDMVCDTSDGIWIDNSSDELGNGSWNVGLWCVAEGQRLLLGDVDGDGFDELVCHGSTGIWIHHPLGPGAPDEVYGAWCNGASEDFRLTDLDWDGLEDFLCVDHDSGNIKHDYSKGGFGSADKEGLDLEEGVQFKWSQAGTIPDMHCTLIDEPADPHTWGDNYFCSSRDVGMQWSYAGPIDGMDCTQIIEEADPHTWMDNYLCLPRDSRIKFSWSEGSIRGPGDVRWHEDAEPPEHTWNDNYLTVSHQ